MTALFILSESDSDTLFYEACAEKITGSSFTPVCRRLRKGAGLGAVRSSLKLAAQEAARMQASSQASFLVAMDNDRSPCPLSAETIPVAERVRLPVADQHKADRQAGIIRVLHEEFGANRAQWPIPVAVAIPVEMVETWWVLMARGGRGGDLPHFPLRGGSGARTFYRGQPPPQLKDLAEQYAQEDGFTDLVDWALDLVRKLDPNDLASRSPSFALFKKWLDDWPKPGRSKD